MSTTDKIGLFLLCVGAIGSVFIAAFGLSGRKKEPDKPSGDEGLTEVKDKSATEE